MNTPAEQIATHMGIEPYLCLGIYEGEVPQMPNLNYAVKYEMIMCAFYAHDVENPRDTRRRIRVHQSAGILGYYVLEKSDFRFQPVGKNDIFVITGIEHDHIMYSDFLRRLREKKYEEEADKAEKKARDAQIEALRAVANAKHLEREALTAREFANKFSTVSYK